MSFQTDIEAYTGSISSLTTEAAKYLLDGVKYMTKILMQDDEMAARMTALSTLNNSTPTLTSTVMANVLKIVSVTRSDGTIFRQANEIDPSKAGLYSDTNSIYVTSKLDPKYYIEANVMNILPTPTASETAKVYSISPVSSVAISATSIAGLPTEVLDGVVFYAAKNILLKKMVNYTKPNVTDAGIASTDLTADIVTGNLTTAADNLDFDKWFDVLGDLIADEDIELAQVQTDKIRAYVETYNVANATNQTEYQWYESQYVKVSKLLMDFIEPYIVGRLASGGGPPNEVATNG